MSSSSRGPPQSNAMHGDNRQQPTAGIQPRGPPRDDRSNVREGPLPPPPISSRPVRVTSLSSSAATTEPVPRPSYSTSGSSQPSQPQPQPASGESRSFTTKSLRQQSPANSSYVTSSASKEKDQLAKEREQREQRFNPDRSNAGAGDPESVRKRPRK
jgi:hypothetical protein